MCSMEKSTVNRFYELKELEGLNSKLNKTDPVKIFICNYCNQWNKIHESDIIASDDLIQKRKKEKTDIRIEVTPEFKVMFKKLVANFGTAEKALIVLMSDFYKNAQ